MVQTHKPLNDAVVFGESLIDDIQGGVIICQLEPASQLSKTIYVSEGWTQLTGYTIEQLEECFDGDPTALILPEDRRQSLLDYENCLSQGRSYQSQYRIRHRDGRILWCIDRGVATSLGNGVFQNQSILTDITLLKENEERLRHEARSDALTGLYNKSALYELVTQALSEEPKAAYALLVLDVDNFKGLNDSLGHLFGDAVLMDVAAKLRSFFWVGSIVGRVGGDEFAILLPAGFSTADVIQRAKDACRALRHTYHGEKADYEISCSIGLAFSEKNDEFESLFRKADYALYQAKTKGKNRCAVYAGESFVEWGICRPFKAAAEHDSGRLEMKERIFELLYRSKDFSGSINMILSLLGQRLGVSRISLFEHSVDNDFTFLRYEWAVDDAFLMQSCLHQISFFEVGCKEYFDKRGIFYCENTAELPPEVRRVAKLANTHSFFQVALMDDREQRGIMSYDNVDGPMEVSDDQADLMMFAAKVVGTFMVKRRADESVKLYNKNKMEALDVLPSSIYVIDGEYRLHYVNDFTRLVFPEVRAGMKCHDAFMGNAEPCSNCPGEKCQAGPCSTEIFNPVSDMRVIASASTISWSGCPNMRLICCQPRD